MQEEDKKLKEAIRLTIKILILQEVRVLQLEQTHSPSMVMDEIIRSIQEAKREIISLVRWMAPKERNALIKRVIRQSVDEEIDQAIKVRKNKCLRCMHVRYVDEGGTPHIDLPIRKGRAWMIGCEITPAPSKIQCKGFIESSVATSLEDYLMDMAFLYEIKEMFDRFEEIWKDYLTK